MRRLFFLLLSCATALRLPPPTAAASRRQAVSIAAAVLVPFTASAPASAKVLKKPSKDSVEKAREYKLSKPQYGIDDGSPEFLANARRREDFYAGVKPRDGAGGVVRDPVTGEGISKRRTYSRAIADGDDVCGTPGACGRKGKPGRKN